MQGALERVEPQWRRGLYRRGRREFEILEDMGRGKEEERETQGNRRDYWPEFDQGWNSEPQIGKWELDTMLYIDNSVLFVREGHLDLR